MDDVSQSKDTQELRDLTKVVRSIDLKATADNEKEMTDANGNRVIYSDESYVLEMDKYPRPKVTTSQKDGILFEEFMTDDDRDIVDAHPDLEGHGEPEGRQPTAKVLKQLHEKKKQKHD